MQFRLFLIAMLLIVGFTFDWEGALYGDAEQMQFDKWYKNEFLPQAFQDTIQGKEDFSTYYLKRVHFDSKHLHPKAALRLDYSTYDFIKVGDVISKNAGDKKATVIKPNGKKHVFELQYCKLKFFKKTNTIAGL